MKTTHKMLAPIAQAALLFLIAAVLSGCNQVQPTLPVPTQPPLPTPTVEISSPTPEPKPTLTSTPPAPKPDFAQIANGFVDESIIANNIQASLAKMGLEGGAAALVNGEVRIEYEQPAKLLPAELRILYLTVFNSASRFAPYSPSIFVAVKIGGEPFIGMRMAAEDIRAYRHQELDEESLLKRMLLFAPDEFPQ